jgi:hypothetical protein
MQMPSGAQRAGKGVIGKFGLIVTGLALSVSCLSAGAADSRWAGYLLDRSCADGAKANGMPADESHKKECALNTTCSKDGYAIYSKGQWYQLDKKGNDLARQMLQTTKTTQGHFVLVSGTLEKEQIKVSSLKELAKQE